MPLIQTYINYCITNKLKIQGSPNNGNKMNTNTGNSVLHIIKATFFCS